MYSCNWFGVNRYWFKSEINYKYYLNIGDLFIHFIGFSLKITTHGNFEISVYLQSHHASKFSYIFKVMNFIEAKSAKKITCQKNFTNSYYLS